jgi:tetratricopeptide (TPR) repeat protein
MQTAKCQDCGSQRPRAEMIRLNDKILCEPCAEKELSQIQAAQQTASVARAVDPTICTQCKADFGSSPLPVIGTLPFCSSCSQLLYNRPFPGWLKSSLAGLFLLLGVALWHGIPYFKAGRSLVLGERAIEHHNYRQATPHLEQVLQVSPTGQKGVLLAAKAYVLSGDIENTQKTLNRRKEYENDDLFKEVNGIWTRASTAFEKGAQAAKLSEEEKDEEAAKLMQEATNEYPESPDLALAATMYNGFAAFDRKDYDRFLALSRKALQTKPDDPGLVAMVASALACKYAISGDNQYRTEAEQLLERARILSQGSPELKSTYLEYSERIRYRLGSREILTKKEYDKRFRAAKGDSKGNS